jgi:hypothetical protein
MEINVLVVPDRMDQRPNNPLLVACRARREWNVDDAVAGCRLIVASSFRAFY